MMNKYIGITIGPIVKTLMMARKPRELYSASYLLSFVSKCILEHIKQNAKGIILSPAYGKLEEKDNNRAIDTSSSAIKSVKIGLYPDRVFYKYAEEDTLSIEDILNTQLWDSLKSQIFNSYFPKDPSFDFLKNYFKISAIQIESANDGEAIRALNHLLDGMELTNSNIKDEVENPVLELIRKRNNSPLFKIASGSANFEIPTLGEISAAVFSQENSWETYKSIARDIEYTRKQLREIRRRLQEEGIEQDYEEGIAEDVFYALLHSQVGEKFLPYHKYVCVVQADGDNIGKTVNHLEGEVLTNFSTDLMEFDNEAKICIEEYGGLPIYCGGDDLLFIAPVVGFGGNIFNLLDQIDGIFHRYMYSGEDYKYSKEFSSSMSYGVSINYYKYPLYAALQQARCLLFETAKRRKEKNAVAWSLQKNSGSKVECVLTKNGKVKKIFAELIDLLEEDNGNLISAVAHKIKANQEIVKLFLLSDDKERLLPFFETFLDLDSKSDQQQTYLDKVRELLSELIAPYVEVFKRDLFEKLVDERIIKETEVDYLTYLQIQDLVTERIVENMYCILRTVKFIKGLEEDHE